MVDRIARYSTDRLQGEERRLANCEAMLPALADARIAAAKALLDREITRIPVLVQSRLQEAGARLDISARLLGAMSQARVSQASQRLDALRERLMASADSLLKKESTKLDNLSGLVDALSPLNTLKRGYSITRVDGKAVTDAKTLSPGQTIETELRQGRVVSVVK